MKKILYSLLFMLMPMLACAEPITADVAQKKAAEFIIGKKGSFARSLVRGMNNVTEVAASLEAAESRDEFYVFNLPSQSGYVIVSGDDRMPAVLGYSDEGAYVKDSLPENMRAWMEEYAAQYVYLQANGDAVTSASVTSVVGDYISPMLGCNWNQGSPYNNKCPYYGGRRCVTGCVATAMAQIMYYHKWPKATTKVIPGYVTREYNIGVEKIGITSINWDNMNSDEIAKLMLLCGTSVEMDYTPSGSSASTYDAMNALVEYFDYKGLSISYNSKSSYDNETWNQMIYDELADKRPVLYSGQSSSGGHAFVIDGYDGNNFFHVNWGWGGYKNGNFVLTSLNGYNSGQSAVTGIAKSTDKPNTRYAYTTFEDDGTFTFCYDNKYEEKNGIFTRLNPQWLEKPWEKDEEDEEEVTKLKKVVFDSSFADYKNLKNTSYWFYGCSELSVIEGLENFNTDNVINMSGMFYGCTSLANLDLSNFNTENVTDMSYMFGWCQALTSLDVSSFNTENVTNMSWMFGNCSSLGNLDVRSFNTENVTDMSSMFSGCNALTSLDVSSFNTKNVTNMSRMFGWCQALTSLNLSSFNTENVTAMSSMFSGCSSLTSLDVSNFNTENVTNMYCLFYNCKTLANLDLSSFKTENVTDMSYMFNGCNALTSLDLSSFNTANVTNMSSMFSGCSSLTSLDVSSFNTENVTDMSWMFENCSSLTSLDVSSFNTENVTNMSSMFRGCSSLTSLDVSSFNTENVTAMSSMFNGCNALTSLDVSSFNTKNVTNMSYMFNGCSSLTSLDVSSFNTENVTNMSYMFYGCSSITSLDVSSFNTKSIKNLSSMFRFCYELRAIIVGYADEWDIIDVPYSENMFYGCYKLVGKYGDNISSGVLDKEAAFVGEGGYFQDVYRVPYAILDDGVLTFYYDDKEADRKGEKLYDITYTRGEWRNDSESITKVVFESSFEDYRGITSLAYFFYDFKNLTSIQGLRYLNTKNVTNMSYMFYGCSSLGNLDVSNFNTENVTNMGYMFCYLNYLTTIYASNLWSTANVTESSYMFYACSGLTGGNGTKYSYSNIDASYARIDGGSSAPGYFTFKALVTPGDANGDGKVSIADVTTVASYLLGETPEGFNEDGADANGDGKVSIADVTTIASMLLE